MRIFIGIFPSQEVLTQIRDVIRSLDKIKRNFEFSPYEQMHITVKFVGAKVGSDSIQQIKETLLEISQQLKPVEVEIDQIFFGLPGQRFPKVMFFTIKPNTELDNFTTNVHEAVRSLQLHDTIRKKDRRKLIQHITIARCKRSVSGSLVRQTREVLKNVKLKPIKFTINNLVLMESQLQKSGPVYKKIGQYQIKPKV
jgi:2'-5' RNA ligase